MSLEYKCKHERRNGDNYGVSCYDCGEQLAGYGYWGSFPNCIHVLRKAEDGNYAYCLYCEREFDLNIIGEGENG